MVDQWVNATGLTRDDLLKMEQAWLQGVMQQNPDLSVQTAYNMHQTWLQSTLNSYRLANQQSQQAQIQQQQTNQQNQSPQYNPPNQDYQQYNSYSPQYNSNGNGYNGYNCGYGYSNGYGCW